MEQGVTVEYKKVAYAIEKSISLLESVPEVGVVQCFTPPF